MMTHLDIQGDSSVPTLTLPVPKAWCDGERIYWRSGDPVRTVDDLSRALLEFVELRRADQVSGFVKRYGPLYLCSKHRQFAMHSRPDLCPPDHRGSEAKFLEIHEPIAGVLYWAGFARSLVELGEKANKLIPITAVEWKRFGLDLDAPLPSSASFIFKKGKPDRPAGRVSRMPAPTIGANSKRLIQGLVNRWLLLAAPRPFLALRENGQFGLLFSSGDGVVNPPRELDSVAWQILAGGILWTALALQLASNMSGGVGMAVCSSCGTLYVPSRAPVQMRNRFCQQCGTRAAWRLAKRRERSGSK